MRSCAEVLRLLATRESFDEESQDMAAFLVFSLRGIAKTIEESALSWDDKNYWKKAEGLRQKWRWSELTAAELEELVVAGQWQRIPPVLIGLIPYFADVNVQTITRGQDWWVGARRSLLLEREKQASHVS